GERRGSRSIVGQGRVVRALKDRCLPAVTGPYPPPPGVGAAQRAVQGILREHRPRGGPYALVPEVGGEWEATLPLPEDGFGSADAGTPVRGHPDHRTDVPDRARLRESPRPRKRGPVDREVR